jgi:hypothetical protein
MLEIFFLGATFQSPLFLSEFGRLGHKFASTGTRCEPQIKQAPRGLRHSAFQRLENGSVALSSGLVRILRKVVQRFEEFFRLAEEKSHACQELDRSHAAPFVSVGRVIEYLGSFLLRNGHGSGMIRLIWKVWPPTRRGIVGSVPCRAGNQNALKLPRKPTLHCNQIEGE